MTGWTCAPLALTAREKALCKSDPVSPPVPKQLLTFSLYLGPHELLEALCLTLLRPLVATPLTSPKHPSSTCAPIPLPYPPFR